MTDAHGGVWRWQIGAVEVTAVLESADAFSSDFLKRVLLPDATAENVASMPWLVPHWADAAGNLAFVTQAFVVRSEGLTIIVDTCLGNDKERRNPRLHMLKTPFLERLALAGVKVDDVDIVLCTHLHLDHVGWNTRWDGTAWVPTFPRARYLFARAEWDHWKSNDHHAFVIADSIQPVIDAGLVDLVAMDHRLTSEVALLPTPGHTPGHVAVVIRSGGAEALITGDLLHHPAQVGRPDWTSPADTDRTAAHATRVAVLGDACSRRVLVLGTHFAPPAAGHVVAASSGTWTFNGVPGEVPTKSG
jgi:glyoxylase-like metal-dependent hydrolase (beta-lactamase superfamily II)